MWIQRWQKLSSAQRVATAASAAAVAVWTAVLIVPDAPVLDEAHEVQPAAPDPRSSAQPSDAAGNAQRSNASQQSSASQSDQRSNAQQSSASNRAQQQLGAPGSTSKNTQPSSNGQQPGAPGSAQQTSGFQQPGAPGSAQSPSALAPSSASEPQPSATDADPVQALREGLASDNSGTRIGALRKLADQPAEQALPELLKLDVARDPEVAPTLIDTTAKLAQHAPAPQRTAAVAQLSTWLQSETTRPSADARGNVSLLVETLGKLSGPEAERALIAVLQSDQQPLHVQTLAVEGLARQASPSAQAALTQFRAQLAQKKSEGFELELKREAELATDKALARLSR